MTREEAIKFAEHAVNMTDIPEVKEFYRLAASALRPVSREQVEKVWRKKKKKDIPMGYKCNSCEGLIVGQTPFCPVCGKAMTDKAVEMVMERWKEVIDGETD